MSQKQVGLFPVDNLKVVCVHLVTFRLQIGSVDVLVHPTASFCVVFFYHEYSEWLVKTDFVELLVKMDFTISLVKFKY